MLNSRTETRGCVSAALSDGRRFEVRPDVLAGAMAILYFAISSSGSGSG